MAISRRNLLKGITMGTGALALSACQVKTVNGVTTITLDVGEVVADTNIALTIAKTALGFTGVPAGVVTIVDEGVTLIETGLNQFKTTAGNSLVLTFNSTSVPAAFTSIISDLKTVAANIAAVAKSEGSNISSGVLTQIDSVSSDIANVASVLESIVTDATSASATLGARTTAEQRRQLVIRAIKVRHNIK